MSDKYKELFESAFRKTNDYKFYRENDMSDTQIFSKKSSKYECHTVKEAFIIWSEAMKIVKELQQELEDVREQYQDSVWESWGEDN